MGETPELDLLNLFVAVADASSFSVAARKLGLPKSSVSRGIARLEASLGTQLLHRTTHTVGLTAAGTALYERVAPLVAALAQAVASVPEQREVPSGLLRVTVANDLGSAVLGDLVPRFTQRFPDVKVDVRLTNAFVDLVGEGLDLALRISTGALKDSTLIARKLSAIELHLYASPSYVARRGQPKSPDELGEHDWVLPRAWKSMPALPALQEAPHIVADDFSFIRAALRTGGGIGVLPSFLAHEELSRGTLVRVYPKFAETTGTLFLVHPQMQHVPAKITAFRDFLLEQLATRPPFAK